MHPLLLCPLFLLAGFAARKVKIITDYPERTGAILNALHGYRAYSLSEWYKQGARLSVAVADARILSVIADKVQARP